MNCWGKRQTLDTFDHDHNYSPKLHIPVYNVLFYKLSMDACVWLDTDPEKGFPILVVIIETPL